MRKLFAFLLLTIGVCIVTGMWVMKKIQSGATRTYSLSESQKSRYLGLGKRIYSLENAIFVEPPNGQSPFFDHAENKAHYDTSYHVKDIPTQDEIKYVVGYVLGWKNISDSPDKYLIIYEGGGLKEAYRVAGGESDLFGTEQTILAVEDVDARDSRGQNVVAVVKTGVGATLPLYDMQKVVRLGDVVILQLVWDFPYLSKRDQNGKYLVSALVVRRNGGLAAINNELMRVP